MADQPPVNAAIETSSVGTGNGSTTQQTQPAETPAVPVYPIQASVTIITPKEPTSPESGISLKKVEAVTGLLKVALWPAIVLLLLCLFYTPVSSVLEALPSKVRESNKISVGSLSFEIQQAAKAAGNPELAALIGNLSPKAVETLLRIQGPWGYVSESNNFESIYIPSDEEKLILAELEKANLIEFDKPRAEYDKFIDSLPLVNAYPDSKTSRSFKPTRPLTEEEKSRVRNQGYHPTKQGEKAHALILEAIKQSLKKPEESADSK